MHYRAELQGCNLQESISECKCSAAGLKMICCKFVLRWITTKCMTKLTANMCLSGFNKPFRIFVQKDILKFSSLIFFSNAYCLSCIQLSCKLVNFFLWIDSKLGTTVCICCLVLPCFDFHQFLRELSVVTDA